MKNKIIFLLTFIFISVNQLFAIKVITTSNDDWTSHASWSTNQVPGNPDTIVIRHYITLSQNLTISAPTVLIIEEGGTLCGDYLLDVACGATIINYGHLYLNTAKIRNGTNYNEFYSKSLITILGCTPQADGFYNLAPNGHTYVWPPVLCKTFETNWKGDSSTGIVQLTNESFISISPNPLNSGYLSINANGDFDMKLFDTQGVILYAGSGTDKAFIDVRGYSNGFYFVALTYKNKQIIKKILIAQ